jgi:hypothetical protein
MTEPAEPSTPPEPALRHRGNVDYVLRTAHQHHVALSTMADQKANILVGCAFLMLTLLWGHVSTGPFRIGAIVLAVFTAAAAIFALLAVIPRFRKPAPGKENFLFFGHFAEFDEQTHIQELRKRLASDDILYETWIRDLHQLGKALYFGKYRFLSISYRLLLTGFLVGGAVSVIERIISGF